MHAIPAPWQLGLIAFLLSLPWFCLAILPYLLPESIPVPVCIMIGLVWAAAAFRLLWYWSSGTAWNAAHRLALLFGALLASMLAGFIINGPSLSPVDLAAKIILNIFAILFLIRLTPGMQPGPVPQA